MKFVGKCSISKKKAKEGFEYPIIRFPKEYSDMIGKIAEIYEIDENKFLISVDENELANQLDNPYTLIKVDKNLLEKAKELEIDISAFLEEKLKELLNYLKVAPGPGFEPGSRARQARMIGRATPPGLRELIPYVAF